MKGKAVSRQQHPRSGKTQTGAGAELARFAGLTRFMLEGSSKYSCWKGADVQLLPCK